MITKVRTVVLFLFFLLLPTQLGSYFFVADSYINGIRIDYLAPALFLSDCLAFVLFVLYLPKIRHFLMNRRVLGIVFVVFGAALFGLSPLVGFYKVLKLIEWFGIAALCVYEGKRDMSHIMRLFVPALAAGSVLELILSVLQIYNQGAVQGVFYWLGERALTITTPEVARSSLAGELFLRPYGTFSHPNSLGGFYLLTYLFVFFFPPAKASAKARHILLFCSTLLIFLSFSKAVIGTFLIVNLLLFFQFVFAKQCKFCGFSRILLVVVLAYIFTSAQGDPLSIDKRIALIDHALTIASQYPLLGTGPGAYLIAESQFPAQYGTFFLQPVHNIFLLALAEVGFLGFGAVIALLLKPFLQISTSRAFRYCFFAILLTGMVDHYWLTLQQNVLLAAVVAGFLWSETYNTSDIPA